MTELNYCMLRKWSSGSAVENESTCWCKKPDVVITASNIVSIQTPWSRVVLEKLLVFELEYKYPAFYGTRGFITCPALGTD